jgi:hypothetical protein
MHTLLIPVVSSLGRQSLLIIPMKEVELMTQSSKMVYIMLSIRSAVSDLDELSDKMVDQS